MQRPIGTSYPFRPYEPWGISSGLTVLRSSMMQIIMTLPGERVMKPTFGCELRRLIFEQNGPKLQAQAIQAVSSSIRRFEPRVRVIDVKAFSNDDGKELLVSVKWQPVNDLNNIYDLNVNLPIAE